MDIFWIRERCIRFELMCTWGHRCTGFTIARACNLMPVYICPWVAIVGASMVRFWRLWEKRVGVDIPKDSLGCDTSNGHNTLLTVNTGIMWMDPDNFDTTRSHSRRVLGRITPASMPSTAVKRVMTSALAGVDKDVIRKDISGNFDVLVSSNFSRLQGEEPMLREVLFFSNLLGERRERRLGKGEGC
eukprot:1334678-Amorphochlora_amoeboformis.AAC.1